MDLLQAWNEYSLEPKLRIIKLERSDLVPQKVKGKSYHCSTV